MNVPLHSLDVSKSDQSLKVLSEVQQLYQSGRYLDAYEAGRPLGDIRHWPGPEGQILAGRLAMNLGAPRLSRVLHSKAYKRWPKNPSCILYGAYAALSRIGVFHTWMQFRNVEIPSAEDVQSRADWLACKASMLALMRDFMRAEQLMASALELQPDSAWLHVEMAELLERQDRHQEALVTVSRSLQLQPWFRPAIQSYGHKLIQARRDEEAKQLLTEATKHLQSGDVWCQLAVLQRELGEYDAAWYSLQRAEEYWPLAEADSHYKIWLLCQFSDLAYFRGEYHQSIDLARKIDHPYYRGLAERLEAELARDNSNDQQLRIQLAVPFIRQHHETCAPATLTALAQYWQHPVEHVQVVQRICYEGTAAYDERRWAEENGFEAREFRITEESAEQLLRAGIPFTLTTVEPGSAHLQAVVGIDYYRGVFLIQDPSERRVTEAIIDQLLERYRSNGPRGMAMVPKEKASLLNGIDLPEADLYDLQYQVDRLLSEHLRDDAVAALRKLRDMVPEHRLTLQAQMAVNRYDSNAPGQLKAVEKLLQQFPSDGNLQTARLHLLGELGTRDQRLKALRAACDSKESHPVFWTRLAHELASDARQHTEAIWRLRRVLRGFQTDGRALATWSNLQWALGNWEAAYEGYRLAAAVSEKDESFSKSYFIAARYLKETQQALEWLIDRHQRLGSRSTQATRTLASALEMLERFPEAIELLESSSAQHADDGDMHCFVAVTFSRYNMRELANRYLELADGKCPAANYLRACALVALNQGRSADARDLYLRVLALDLLDVGTLDRVVELDRDLDGEEVAEKRLREAVAKFPHSYSLQVSFVHWLRNYRPATAQSELDRFIQMYPESAWGQREASILALMNNDLTRAEEFARRAIELEPNNDMAYPN